MRDGIRDTDENSSRCPIPYLISHKSRSSDGRKWMEARSQPAPATGRRSCWRWPPWVVMFAVVWMTIAHLTELKQLLQVLSRGQAEWVLVAAVLEGACYLLHAAVYYAAFRVVDVKSRNGELIRVRV